MVRAIDMLDEAKTDTPGSLAKSLSYSSLNAGSNRRSNEQLQRHSYEQADTPTLDGLPGAWPQTPKMSMPNGRGKDDLGGADGSMTGMPNGSAGERGPSAKSLALNLKTRRSAAVDSEKKAGEVVREETSRLGAAEEGYFMSIPANAKSSGPTPIYFPKPTTPGIGEAMTSTPTRSVSAQVPMTPKTALPPVIENSPVQTPQSQLTDGMLRPPSSQHQHRASSPPAFNPSAPLPFTPSTTAYPTSVRPDRLTHRHTLEVPRVNTRTSLDSRDNAIDGVVSATGRFSPNTPTRRRASLQIARKATRSIHSHSELQLDQIPQDEDAARWTEHIRAKRASKKQRVDTDDERVLIGHKVEEGHRNYIQAYNMLTGIRFTVSRTNAKLDRDLTDADFTAKHKYSFDITGSELTPSAKYDFKFKDYAPWVFRHIRASFRLDPAEYLVSLTAKYILSELGSPGKSGSFFYFSRDYKYIIKTIHHGEHKFLRKILKDYYHHVTTNPDTLLSQFYGLHRVKMPYGKKVHFVIMNNLFPPHRDIHRTFDLKGSTIGRDFKEEDLEHNPRATLKDLNWLRRNLHLEFGPGKKERFVEAIQKDVALLQRLKIMDYSLLVGIHDMERGNEENLRDKMLQVFQPGGHKTEDANMSTLVRTQSKMESAKRARELRETVKKERPIPMAQTIDKMPEEAHREGFYFYADDGGFRATHENNSIGEEIYYLGIIDCLTRYNYIKRAEHFFKGMGGHESQISPIPPDRYGDRFIKFISGITMSRERAELEGLSHAPAESNDTHLPSGLEGTIDDPRLGGVNLARDKRNPPGTEGVMEQAGYEIERSRRHGDSEDGVPQRLLTTVRSAPEGPEAATLPVIGEAAESGSNASRTPSRATLTASRENVGVHEEPGVGEAGQVGAVPPPTPPKFNGGPEETEGQHHVVSGPGGAPPTPPKDERLRGRLDKELPLPPLASPVFSASPPRMTDAEMDRARRQVGDGPEVV